MPGLEEKDIEVLLEDGVLTLGEKRSEIEDRTVSSPALAMVASSADPARLRVTEDKVDARFRNGVLTVTLPKSEKAQSQVKRIAIKS